MSTAIVIGGGVSGLCACRLLAGRHDDIVLIEKEPVLGGLLKSETNDLGHVFDQGTHFITGTTIPELDKVLFEDLNDKDCHIFTDSLAEGNYFNGQLSIDSGCIDTRTLPEEIHAKGLDEILKAPEDDGSSTTLRDFLVKNYGATFTEHVYAPVVEKFTGMDLGDLDPAAAGAFLITRLVVMDRAASIEAKKSPLLDGKIAWAHRDDGTSDIIKRYPKFGGVGAWVEGMERRIRADGVRVMTGVSVSAVNLENATVRAFELDNGETLECDEVIWTVPPVFFLRAADIEFKSRPPKFRNMVLLHYSIDTAVNTDLHWVVNFDPDCVAFRITLYPNITTGKRAAPPHHLTVEVMIDDYDADELTNRVFQELKTTGIIPEEAKALYTAHTDIRPGWPILTTGFKESAKTAFDLAAQTAGNVTFVGRGKSENSHFLHVVLEDLYRCLN